MRGLRTAREARSFQQTVHAYRRAVNDEYAAIRRRDPDAARAACSGCAEVLAKIMVSELIRRGVLDPPQHMAAL